MSDYETKSLEHRKSGNTRLRHPYALDEEGNIIVPAQADNSVAYTCPDPDCDDGLYPRGPSIDGRVRHFYHPSGGGNGEGGECSGHSGESVRHKLCKSHAASMLLEWFRELTPADTVEECYEVGIDSPSGQYRQADACIEFSEPFGKYGNGIVIEVQHKNKSKDIDATTRDYLEAGYSVLWTETKTEYDDGGVLFDKDWILKNSITVWPNAVPEQSDRVEGVPDNLDEILPASHYLNDLRGNIHIHWIVEGKPTVKRRVSLPREWYEERVKELFRETEWDDLFDSYEWDARTTLPQPTNGRLWTIRLPIEWHEAQWRTFYRQSRPYFDGDWDDLFEDYQWDHRTTPQQTDAEMRREVDLPPEWWDYVEEECRSAFDRIHQLSAAIPQAIDDDDIQTLDDIRAMKLGPYYPDEPCAVCGDRSVVYLYREWVVNMFLCDEHFTASGFLEAAEAGTGIR